MPSALAPAHEDAKGQKLSLLGRHSVVGGENLPNAVRVPHILCKGGDGDTAILAHADGKLGPRALKVAVHEQSTAEDAAKEARSGLQWL